MVKWLSPHVLDIVMSTGNSTIYGLYHQTYIVYLWYNPFLTHPHEPQTDWVKTLFLSCFPNIYFVYLSCNAYHIIWFTTLR